MSKVELVRSAILEFSHTLEKILGEPVSENLEQDLGLEGFVVSSAHNPLTYDEAFAVSVLASGKTYKDLTDLAFRSEATIRRRIASAKEKLGIRSGSGFELVAVGVARGIIVRGGLADVG